MATTTTQERIEALKHGLLAPFQLKKQPRFAVARGIKEAERYRDNGWCPIECSAGAESIVGPLQLDHHGEMRHLEGVAIRGYRDHFGARIDDPRIVFFGYPDEDATFCALSVLGLLPHPILGDVFPELPELRHLRATQNLLHLAELINAVDIDPDKGKELENTVYGRMILLWRQLGHPSRMDLMAWYGAMDRWINLLSKDRRKVTEVAVTLHEDMLERVLSTTSAIYGEGDLQVAAADFTEFGRNSVLYDHWTGNKTPVLLAHFQESGVCSIAVRNMAWAKEHIGPNGLMHLYPLLNPGGAGGREVLGGLSRWHRFTWEEAKKQASRIAELLQQIRRGELQFNKRKRRSPRAAAARK